MTRCRACPRPGHAPGMTARRTAAGPGGAATARRTPSELTSREREIAALVASGLSNREIADRLFISRRTVDAHVNHIYAKLRISSRVQLTIWARDRGPGSLPTGCRRPGARSNLALIPPSA